MGVPPFSWVMMKVKNWSVSKRSAAAWRMADGSGGGVGKGVDSVVTPPPVPQAEAKRRQKRAGYSQEQESGSQRCFVHALPRVSC